MVQLTCPYCQFSTVYTKTTHEEVEGAMDYRFGIRGFSCPACKRFGFHIQNQKEDSP